MRSSKKNQIFQPWYDFLFASVNNSRSQSKINVLTTVLQTSTPFALPSILTTTIHPNDDYYREAQR